MLKTRFSVTWYVVLKEKYQHQKFMAFFLCVCMCVCVCVCVHEVKTYDINGKKELTGNLGRSK